MVNRLTTYYKTLPVHAKAAMWFLTCSILQKGFSVITMPFFTRLLNQYDYGLVATYNSWETIVEIFICLRLDYSVFNKGMSKYGDQRDGYVLSMQTTSTFSAIVLLLFFVSFRGFFVDLVGLSDKLCVLLIIRAKFV